jgi:carboxynorspermidine decarboxylase
MVERTPAFVLEYDRFKQNLALIDSLQQRIPARFLLALKGFAMYEVFEEIAKVASGATASSLNEARLAGEYFGEVHAYCPAYNPREFPFIAAIAKHITFNSIAQYERHKTGLGRAKAGLRINPEYSTVETALYNPCIPGSRLGIPASQLQSLPKGISGLHSHNLCESGAEELQGTLGQIERLYGHLLEDIAWLNLGGGHLVTRNGYNQDLLVKTLTDFHERHPHLELILEPGAAFVWETGVLVSEVLDIVENEGVISIMLDTSFAAHMPDCLEMPYTPRVRGMRIRQANEKPANDEQIIQFGGSSCLAGDWVGQYICKNLPQVGDRIVFEDMMHYTMVKTTMFNGIALPDIAIFEDGAYRVVKRFSYENYKYRLS